MRGILFIGGKGPDSTRVTDILGRMSSGDVICAADSGLDAALTANVTPNFVVGDMDSVSDPGLLDQFPSGNVIIYPQDKDYTDTELGLQLLIKKNCSPIIIMGGGEGRLSHTLSLIKCFESNTPPDIWYTGHESVQLINGTFIARGHPEDTATFYPIGLGPWQVESHGLYWELDNVGWNNGEMSLNNRFKSRTIRINIRSGNLLFIRSY